MSSRQLTPVSYLVLGLVDKLGEATPYDLKQAVARSVGYFWSFSHSQIYSEAAGLAGAGLLDEEQEEGGRRRRVYRATDAGREALAAWLREATEVQPEIRDLGLLKLFFAGRVEPGDVQELARRQEEGHRARLAEYEAIERSIPPEAAVDWPHATATLRMGLLLERAFLEFWAAVRERPPG